MTKKVLIINGSSRKKNTYNLLVQIKKILESHNIEAEIINLFDYQIIDCVGCETCVSHKACPKKDDMPIIMEKIMDSDGIIFSSPVYMRSVTSKFKAFADRTNIWVHKPAPAGIPVMFVSTTAATGLKETKRFLTAFATGFGARNGEFIARNNNNMDKPVRKKEISKFLNLLGQDKSTYHPSIDDIVMFAVGKVLALKSNDDDRLFWEEKGWINKYYYYPCKMNLAKKIFAKFMFKVLSKVIK